MKKEDIKQYMMSDEKILTEEELLKLEETVKVQFHKLVRGRLNNIMVQMLENIHIGNVDIKKQPSEHNINAMVEASQLFGISCRLSLYKFLNGLEESTKILIFESVNIAGTCLEDAFFKIHSKLHFEKKPENDKKTH